MDLAVRSSQLEIMDTKPLSSSEMNRVLNFLTLTNKWFGGAAVVTRYLDQWLLRDEHQTWRNKEEPLSILDVGTGAGDIPLAIAEWARLRRVNVQVVGLDLVPDIVDLARQRTHSHSEIKIHCGGLFEIAEGVERFDYVTASLFLHHMPGTQATLALKALDRLARRGLIVSDLVRSKRSYGAVSVASWLFGNHVVRHDGPLSVERSFKRDELQRLADDAQLEYLKAQREPWCRLSLAGQK